MSAAPKRPDHALESDNYRRGATTLVDVCAGVRSGEKVYILSDPTTRSVADQVFAVCLGRTTLIRNETVPSAPMHGAAPPPGVGPAMLWADVVFCLTRMSMAHTPERLAANRKGTRFLSLPDYDLPLLAGNSLRFDFRSAAVTAARLAALLNDAGNIHVRTMLGTDLTFSTRGRRANACPGVCLEAGSLGSPPDAETNIAPLEGSAEGVLKVDGSIPCGELGLLAEPITLEIKAGAIVDINGLGSEPAILQKVLDRLGRPQTRWLAEFGIGLNPLAVLSGKMLEDEGCAGTIHLGFGSNATIGGRIQVPFHLDFVLKEPTVEAGGRAIMRDGNLLVLAPSSDPCALLQV